MCLNVCFQTQMDTLKLKKKKSGRGDFGMHLAVGFLLLLVEYTLAVNSLLGKNTKDKSNSHKLFCSASLALWKHTVLNIS